MGDRRNLATPVHFNVCWALCFLKLGVFCPHYNRDPSHVRLSLWRSCTFFGWGYLTLRFTYFYTLHCKVIPDMISARSTIHWVHRRGILPQDLGFEQILLFGSRFHHRHRHLPRPRHPRSGPGRNAPGNAVHLTTANASIQLYIFGGLRALYSAKKMGGVKNSAVARWVYGKELMFTVVLTEFLSIG